LPVERLLARHADDEIRTFHWRQLARALDEDTRIDLTRGDHPPHHACRTQYSRQRTRVDVGDRHDVVAHEVVAQRAVRSPVAGDWRLGPDDEAGDFGRPRFAVL